MTRTAISVVVPLQIVLKYRSGHTKVLNIIIAAQCITNSPKPKIVARCLRIFLAFLVTAILFAKLR